MEVKHVFKLGTPKPVRFQEMLGPENKEMNFEVRVAAKVSVFEYDEEKYGDGTALKEKLGGLFTGVVEAVLKKKERKAIMGDQNPEKVLAELLTEEFALNGVAAEIEIFSFALTEDSERVLKEVPDIHNYKSDCAPPPPFDPTKSMFPLGMNFTDQTPTTSPAEKKEFFEKALQNPDFGKGIIRLPEVRVERIVEQAVTKPKPISVPAPEPNNYRSELIIENGTGVLSVYSCGMHLEYILPTRLIDVVNQEVKAMLPKEVTASRMEGDADAWVRLEGDDKDYDCDPEDVISLFERLVPQCFAPFPCHENQSFYRLYPKFVIQKLLGAWTCPHCNTTRNVLKFCRTCGAAKNPANGTATSNPRSRAEAPWHCNQCKTDGNTGGYCEECGAAYPGGTDPEAGKKVGYHRPNILGLFGGMGGMLFAQNPNALPPFATQAPAPQLAQSEELKPGEWRCTCEYVNSGKFCQNCGKERPVT